jgi:hypothetical protein
MLSDKFKLIVVYGVVGADVSIYADESIKAQLLRVSRRDTLAYECVGARAFATTLSRFNRTSLAAVFKDFGKNSRVICGCSREV